MNLSYQSRGGPNLCQSHDGKYSMAMLVAVPAYACKRAARSLPSYPTLTPGLIMKYDGLAGSLTLKNPS